MYDVLKHFLLNHEIEKFSHSVRDHSYDLRQTPNFGEIWDVRKLENKESHFEKNVELHSVGISIDTKMFFFSIRKSMKSTTKKTYLADRI